MASHLKLFTIKCTDTYTFKLGNFLEKFLEYINYEQVNHVQLQNIYFFAIQIFEFT